MAEGRREGGKKVTGTSVKEADVWGGDGKDAGLHGMRRMRRRGRGEERGKELKNGEIQG